jgi:hypothetical protein
MGSILGQTPVYTDGTSISYHILLGLITTFPIIPPPTVVTEMGGIVYSEFVREDDSSLGQDG